MAERKSGKSEPGETIGLLEKKVGISVFLVMSCKGRGGYRLGLGMGWIVVLVNIIY